MKIEVEACTSGVGVADISATLKIEISVSFLVHRVHPSPVLHFVAINLIPQGSSAVNLLQFLCSNNVDVQPGSVVQTLLLNAKGGIEAFSTVYRLENDR